MLEENKYMKIEETVDSATWAKNVESDHFWEESEDAVSDDE